MNWVRELVDLYDKNIDKVGIIEYRGKMPYVLLPLYHSTVTAQITVVINENGEFLNACQVEKDDKFTIIPVTEKSGSRTKKEEPHPLCDNLKYLAGDYKKFCNDSGLCFELYINQLELWYKSDYCHPKVKAVYLYLKKETLIRDLVNEKVLKHNAEGLLDDKETIQGIQQTKAFVRFIVRQEKYQPDSEIMDECWKDETLQKCYIDYRQSEDAKKDMCYLSGNIEPISYLHSKKIRNEGDSAKLISSNDDVNFTYRGRFATKEEAFSVGSITSQKFHNALKWIIRKQGESFESLMIVTWESNLLAMPKWYADTDTVVSDYKISESEESQDEDDEWDDEEDGESVSDGNEITARQFYKALNGYGKNVNNTSDMMLLGMDAATEGRLSLVIEKTLDSSRYLENIKKWHESCNWIHGKMKDGKWIQFNGMVGVRDFADILFGTESKGFLTIVDANSKKLYAEVAKRLIPCIWDAQRIPFDYVNIAINKASTPLAYKERKNWERVLTLACSLVKKYRSERNNKEEWKVALDTKCRDRNYLYGRLLAVADRIEYRTYDIHDDLRVTNARRYMNTFYQRPFETWEVIEESIQPYLNKLNLKERLHYMNLLDEINDLFEIDSFKDNSRLNGLYLLGYHNQSCDLKRNKSENNDKEEE